MQRRQPHRPRSVAGARARATGCSPPRPTEFAARGFAGASVDRIAGAARVNKAMIYYHFKSKAALYREILRDMFERRRRRRPRPSRRSTAARPTRSAPFVEAIAAEAEARPHFPPIWFREIAEGGAHLDAGDARRHRRRRQALGGIIEEGVARRRLQAGQPAARPCRHRRRRCCCSFASARLRAAARSAPACRGVGAADARRSRRARAARHAGALEGRM